MSSASTPVSESDRTWLRRCVELATEALAQGDEPFGSVLVDSEGTLLFEDRNRVSGGDATRHPELTIVEWAVANLSPEARRTSTVYTSGEHCPMCSAAHAWVGLGRIVYASSGEQLARWLDEWRRPAGPVAVLSIEQVAPGIEVSGPVDDFADQVRELHRQFHGVQPPD